MRGDLIDVDGTIGLVHEHPSIRLLLIQPSHCRRPQPIQELANGLPDRVTLAVDVSHTAGLIAGGLLPQPLLQGADILTFNTHKTLPGPNKGVIAFRTATIPWPTRCGRPSARSCNRTATRSAFRGWSSRWRRSPTSVAYAEQVVADARTLAQVLDRNGVNVLGMEYGGTQTHQVHVHLGTAEVANKAANEQLPMCGIRTNSVLIPGTGGEFGLRLGTQALTRRGLTEVEFAKLGRLLAQALRWSTDPSRIRQEVADLLADYPLFPLQFSFDQPAYGPQVERLLSEVLR